MSDNPATSTQVDELRASLNRLKMSPVDFSRRLGVARRQVDRWLHGDTNKVPRYVFAYLELLERTRDLERQARMAVAILFQADPANLIASDERESAEDRRVRRRIRVLLNAFMEGMSQYEPFARKEFARQLLGMAQVLAADD